MAYSRLAAEVSRVAADVAAGRLDARPAVARIAMSAPGRLDVLDRVIETVRRLASSRPGGQPATGLLDLLIAAREVVAGEVSMVGPAGVRVRQTPTGRYGSRHPVLLLHRRDGGPVRECRSIDELARHVDLSALSVDPPRA